MTKARIYRRQNRSWGASYGDVQDTGHHIVSRFGDRFTVCSVGGTQEVICRGVSQLEAEKAIAKDWETTK